MAAERPPEIDAEYRIVRGPWPRWVWHFSLFKLALTTAAVVGGCMLLFLLAVLAMRRL